MTARADPGTPLTGERIGAPPGVARRRVAG
jgi:hypothetical protein